MLATRDVDLAGNKITILIPIQVMNLDSVKAGVERDIGVGVFIGDKQIWAVYHKITILEAPAPGSGGPPEEPVSVDVSCEMTHITFCSKGMCTFCCCGWFYP